MCPHEEISTKSNQKPQAKDKWEATELILGWHSLYQKDRVRSDIMRYPLELEMADKHQRRREVSLNIFV